MPFRRVKFITRFSAVVSLAVGLLAPTGYGVISYNNLAAHTEAALHGITKNISQFVSENPGSWTLLGDRIKFLIDEQRLAHEAALTDATRVSVFDRQGTNVATSGLDPTPPELSKKASIFDFGVEVGTVRIQVSTQPLIVRTAGVAGISALLAVLIFFPLRILPLRALEQAADELATARNVLIQHEARRVEALGNLAGGMAHELNNMLLPILSLTDLVRKGQPEGSRERNRLDKVVEAAERASSIVDSVLEFSRMRQAEARRLDLAAVVSGGLDVVSKTAPSTADIRTRITDRPCFVHGNDRQLQTVLIHLVSNAIEALSGSPGRVTIGVDVVRLNGRSAVLPHLPDGEYAELSVADTGVGMDEETRSRLFDPFFTTKEVGEGVGLGLAMVHGIAEQHGGAITVDSAPGSGSTFRLLLPLLEA